MRLVTTPNFNSYLNSREHYIVTIIFVRHRSYLSEQYISSSVIKFAPKLVSSFVCVSQMVYRRYFFLYKIEL